MPRPRQEEGPPANERLERVFFEQLKTTPFSKMTVSGIVKAAGVNRNSFYYHFTDLDDLAESAVAHLLVTDIPRLIAEGFSVESAQVSSAIEQAIRDKTFSRLITVVGPHSTDKLKAMLKATIVDSWLAVYGLEEDDLDDNAWVTMRFVLGGMFEVLSTVELNDLKSAMVSIRKAPIRELASRMLADTLREVAVRAGKAAG